MVGSHHSTSSSHSVLYDGHQKYAGTQVDLKMTTTSFLPNTCMHIAMPVSLTQLNPNTITTFPRPWRELSGYNPQDYISGNDSMESNAHVAEQKSNTAYIYIYIHDLELKIKIKTKTVYDVYGKTFCTHRINSYINI